jgi:hypothetical protein
MNENGERKIWPADSDEKGLACRNCGCKHFYTDHTKKGVGMVIRYKHCRHCGKRAVSIERIAGSK